MNRLEFMKELARLLDDLPREEKIEILKYYNGYFDDAGQENEAAIIEELGSPAKVAASVKAGMDESSADHVEFTEKGVNDEKTVHEYEEKQTYREEKYSTEKYSTEKYGAGRQRERNGWKAIAIICLVLLTFPLWITVLALLAAACVGLIMAVFGIALAVVICMIAFLGCGIGSLIWGILKLFTVPLSGALSISVGIMLLGAGLLVFLLCTVVFGKLIPLVFRAVGNLFRWLSDRIHRRERA